MKNHAFSFRPRLLVLSMLLAATQPAASAVRTWDGNGNTDNWGFINNPSLNTNWTANAPTLTHPLPDSGDSLIFAGNTRTANTNDLSALSVAGLSFAAGAGAFTLGGNALTSTGNITNSSSNLQTINLPISVGGIQTWDGGAPGLTVNGAVTLGNNALTLQNKTAIANGSSTVVVGNGGTASLNLQSGSTITANEGTIGNTPSGNGTVTVDGAGSAWNNAARMFVGLSGAGSLTIQNGGKVSNGQGYLGYFAGSSGTATVTGAGSQWINNADLKVGITDDGVLSILNGGSVSNNDGYLGYISGSTGSVTVGGAGSAWNNANNLYLGFDANAASSVTVNGGGTVSMGNALNIGEKGALNLSGGTVTAASASKAAGGQFNWTSGTLQLAGLDLDAGSSLFGHSLALGSGQQFNTTGLLNLGAAGSVNVGSGATLQVGAGGTVGSVSGNITDNGQVVFNRSNDLSYDGVISGSGGLAKNGGGVLTLTGTNTYTGATTVNAGTLALGAAERIADASTLVVNGGSFDLNNYNETVGSLAGGGGAVNLGAGTLTAGGDNTNTSYVGTITGSGGLTKTGSGILTLTGTNTYTGATTVYEGTLKLGASNRIDDASALVVNGGGTFDLGQSGYSETVGSLAGSGGTLSLLGSNLTVGGDNTDTSYFGSIIGGTLHKQGSGTLTLGLSPSFYGLDSLDLNGGGVRFSAAPSNNPLYLNLNAGTFELMGDSTIARLDGSSLAEVKLGNRTLFLSPTNYNIPATFGGVISGTGGVALNSNLT